MTDDRPLEYNDSNTFVHYDPAYVIVLTGLNNTGAICWCNSLMQSLLSCSSFNQKMLKYATNLRSNDIANTYVDALRISQLPRDIEKNGNKIQCQQNDAYRLYTLSSNIIGALINVMTKKKRQFTFGRQQECVQEAITLILDMLDFKPITNLFIVRYARLIRCQQCQKITSCEKDTDKENTFVDYHIGTSNARSSDDFIKRIISFKSPVSDYKCEKCNKNAGNTVRVEELRLVREIITIVLKDRYFDGLTMLGPRRQIWFPRQFRIGGANGAEFHYKLVAVMEHSGGLGGGHYWATVLRDGRYCRVNDSSCEIVGLDDIPFDPNGPPNMADPVFAQSYTTAFMLFYHIV